LYINDSVATLKDTIIEENGTIDANALDILDSQVMMDHCHINDCHINDNYAKSVFLIGKLIPSSVVGIFIHLKSAVTMNDVTFKGNVADDDVGAIANAGTLWHRFGPLCHRRMTIASSSWFSRPLAYTLNRPPRD
jgi:hypothetical protein